MTGWLNSIIFSLKVVKKLNLIRKSQAKQTLHHNLKSKWNVSRWDVTRRHLELMFQTELTSSGFSLVILTAITWPFGTGLWIGLSKSISDSPHGSSPYNNRISLILCNGIPITICQKWTEDKDIESVQKTAWMQNEFHLKEDERGSRWALSPEVEQQVNSRQQSFQCRDVRPEGEDSVQESEMFHPPHCTGIQVFQHLHIQPF